MTTFIQVCLWAFAAWFTLGSISLAVAGTCRRGHTRTALFSLAAMTALVVAVQVLAAVAL